MNGTSSISVCRLCLFNNTAVINLFDVKIQENHLAQKILKYLNFEVKEDDNLPKDICWTCFEKIEAFHKFYEEVSQNQSMLAYAQTQPNPVIITSACSAIGDSSSKQVTVAHHQLQEFIKIEDSAGQQLDLRNLNGSIVAGSGQTPTTIAVISSVSFSNGQATTNYTIQEVPVSQTLPSALSLVAEGPEESQDNLKTDNDEYESVQQMETTTEEQNEESMKESPNAEHKFRRKKDSENHPISVTTAIIEEFSSNNVLKEEKAVIDPLESIEFPDFPKNIIQDTKLLIRGKSLLNLMSKFYRLECDLCVEGTKSGKKGFKKLSALCSHYTDLHGIKGYVICCGIKLIKPRAMAMHMARHLQPDAFKCSECGKMMTCPKILQYHVQNHLPEEKRPLPCPDCPRRFSYSSALVAHSISHQPESERAAHVCDECGKSFSSPGRLSTHINVAHTKQGNSFVCHVCAKQFACKGNLTYHLTTHQPRVHQVQCQQCGKWLKNKLCLRKHMVQHGSVRFNCDRCEYSAVNRQCLRNHVRVQHTDLKPYNCSECGRAFKLKNTLLNHMVQHTGLKKFSCQFCSRTFASSGNFYSHRKRMHPNELADYNRKREEEENILRAKALAGKQ